MSSSLRDIGNRLAKVKPWIAFAMVLGLGLLGYYGFLGIKYLGASEEVSALESEIRTVSATLRRPSPDAEALQGELDLQEKRLSAVRSLSSNLHSDDLVGILAATARETDVFLSRIGVGDGATELLDGVQYQTRPMSLSLTGEETRDIFQFLTSVQQKVPLTSVPAINITSSDAERAAQVQIVFFLSPQTKSD
jgi:hypothetical protein